LKVAVGGINPEGSGEENDHWPFCTKKGTNPRGSTNQPVGGEETRAMKIGEERERKSNGKPQKAPLYAKVGFV